MTIKVFLSVGGENGILVKNYLKIPINNFQIEIFMMTIIRTNEAIHTNLEKFRIDFVIERLFRIKDVALENATLL